MTTICCCGGAQETSRHPDSGIATSGEQALWQRNPNNEARGEGSDKYRSFERAGGMGAENFFNSASIKEVCVKERS